MLKAQLIVGFINDLLRDLNTVWPVISGHLGSLS